MGMITSTGRNNDEMVDNLIKSRSLTSKQIELAFRLVDRGNFLHPAERTHRGYNDSAYRESYGDPIGHFHLSAPSIYAMVLESFDVQRGMSFLNIGSGTGYFSSIIGFLLGENGISHGVEIFEHLVQFSEDRALEVSQSAATSAYGWCVPRYFYGNALQLRAQRRYDRIYCGALVPPSRRSFFCDMLHVNGVLVMPYRGNLIRVYRASETTFQLQSISSVMFGSLIQPEPENRLTDRPLSIEPGAPLTLEEICRVAIRDYLRHLVIDESGLPAMRCRTMTSEGRFQRSADSESADERSAAAGHCPLFRHINARNEAFTRGGGGNAERERQNRPRGNAHQQAVDQLVHVIDNRYARHRQALARNAQLNNRINNGGRQVNFLQLQREQERKKGGDRMLLDNDEFELIKEFRFERLVGGALVEDVENGLAESDDEDNDDADRGGLPSHQDSSSSDSSDDDDRNDQDRPLPANRVMPLLRRALRNVEPVAATIDRPVGGEIRVAGEARFPTRERDVVIRFYDCAQNNRASTDQAQQNSTSDSAVPLSQFATSSNTSLRSGGKRTGTNGDEEEAGTSKRVRSRFDNEAEQTAGSSSSDINPVIEQECYNEQTAKIMQDEIGHALDAATDENNERDGNAEVLADHRDDNHPGPSHLIVERSTRDASESDVHQRSLHSSSSMSRNQNSFRNRVLGLEQRLIQICGRNASREHLDPSARTPETSGDESGTSSARPARSDATTRPSASDTEMEESDREDQERNASIERQAASLRDFAQHFASHVEALPITQRLVVFLQYKQ